MRYESIADIYSANEKVRARFTEVASGISPEEAKTLPEGEKWCVEQIVEHISLVGFGVSQICSKLLAKAKMNGEPSDGTFALSANFGERAAVISGQKVEAPDRVHPSGQVSIDEAQMLLASASQAFRELRPDLESLDLSGHTFPHPFFGDLNAGEWLVMAGLHESRHTDQIERLLAKIRQ